MDLTLEGSLRIYEIRLVLVSLFISTPDSRSKFANIDTKRNTIITNVNEDTLSMITECFRLCNVCLAMTILLAPLS